MAPPTSHLLHTCCHAVSAPHTIPLCLRQGPLRALPRRTVHIQQDMHANARRIRREASLSRP